MLGACGIRLRRTCCTLLLARLALRRRARRPPSRRGRAPSSSSLELPKDEQASDWGAERLSESQLEYAAADAVVAQRLAAPLWRTWTPARAAPSGSATHRAGGRRDAPGRHPVRPRHPRADDRCTGSRLMPRRASSSSRSPARSRRCTARERSEWLEAAPARGHAGLVAAHRDRAAAGPQLPTSTAWRRAGDPAAARGDCGRQALAQLRAQPAREGRRRRPAAHGSEGGRDQDRPLLLLRPEPPAVAAGLSARPWSRHRPHAGDRRLWPDRAPRRAELSGDAAMREVFARRPRHAPAERRGLPRAIMPRKSPPEQRDTRKRRRLGFGVIYGSGARGLVASAWSQLPDRDDRGRGASCTRTVFYARYPRLRQWQIETAEAARATGVLRSVAGRPLRAEWEAVRRAALDAVLQLPRPVVSAADVMMLAMAGCTPRSRARRAPDPADPRRAAGRVRRAARA